MKQSSIDHLFLLIRVRLHLSALGIRRVNMQLGKYTLEWTREGTETLDAMRTIVKNDIKQVAEVVSGKKICFPRKAFLNHGKFLEYLLIDKEKFS